jgi:hypothetical protein
MLIVGAIMWPVGACVRGSTVALVVALAMLVAGEGCAKKVASVPRPSLWGCGGLFTPVALPHVSRDEQRELEESAPHLTASELDLRLRRNYYRILYAEDGISTGEARDAFVDRMLSEEHVPPGLLAGVEPESLKFAVAPTPEQRRDLQLAIAEARRPLAQRLDRVAARLTSAAARPDITYCLDVRMRLNAGAELGFGSHRILVGPSLILLTGSEDALAFVLGHELAHVVHHHTKFKAAQDLFVWVATLGYATGRTGETISGILSQGGTAAINRDKECEADYYALQYTRGAGYRPEAAAEFWELMLALRPKTSRWWALFVWPFVSGYPPEAERVLRLARWAGVDVLHSPSAGLLLDVQSSGGAGPATVQDLSPEDAIESFGLVLE